ncbi:DsbA family protein [Virgisporangium aliadipatigenens]|uniref:DsbA family protein n=1 Tax=Virgisporangium aliadipatigenens TaxID=741659 RepID=UPI001944A1CD|nr:thioredoxin domain-containing protein [Virgisporangium aliadipatigenens]
MATTQTRRRTAAREQRRLAAAAAERRRRLHRRLFAAGAVVIVALVAAVVVAVVRAATGGDAALPRATGGLVVPANATAAGAVIVGRADAPVTVAVYLDYLCPYCARFEQANAADLERLTAAGTMRLELHPLAFLDRLSAGTRYSTRSAAALAAVADAAPERVLAFNRALYERQPAEGGPGLTDAAIAAIAVESGVDGAVADRLRDGRFAPWVLAGTDAATAAGVTGTPTVRVDGKAFTGDLYSAGPLARAVEAAAGQR